MFLPPFSTVGDSSQFAGLHLVRASVDPVVRRTPVRWLLRPDGSLLGEVGLELLLFLGHILLVAFRINEGRRAAPFSRVYFVSRSK